MTVELSNIDPNLAGLLGEFFETTDRDLFAIPVSQVSNTLGKEPVLTGRERSLNFIEREIVRSHREEVAGLLEQFSARTITSQPGSAFRVSYSEGDRRSLRTLDDLRQDSNDLLIQSRLHGTVECLQNLLKGSAGTSLDQAHRASSSAMLLSPSDDSRLHLGAIAVTKKEYRTAKRQFRLVADSGVTTKAAYGERNLGMCFLHLGEYDKAAAYYLSSLELDCLAINSAVGALLTTLIAGGGGEFQFVSECVESIADCNQLKLVTGSFKDWRIGSTLGTLCLDTKQYSSIDQLGRKAMEVVNEVLL